MSLTTSTPALSVRVDAANPGQYFACCGLLELAHRACGDACGWFDDTRFHVATSHSAGTQLFDEALRAAEPQSLDPQDVSAPPLELREPFKLRLDWWRDVLTGGDRLKVWAGSMRGHRIARAMHRAIPALEAAGENLLDFGAVVYDPEEPDKKVEPFYFDARRGSAARSLDIGFAPDSLGMTSVAYPAVEFFSLVGLQRFRPMPTEMARVFDYFTWAAPLPPSLGAGAVCGCVGNGFARYRFENGFRTDQRKHKGFLRGARIDI